MVEPSENRTLYDQGQRYVLRVKRRLGSTWDERTAVAEIAATRITERGETRADDRVSEAAMEDRKRVGYF